MSSGKYAFWWPVALIRPSRSACSSSQIRYPYGLITMLPRTGPRSTSSARKITSLYQAEKSSLCGVTLRSSRTMIFRLQSGPLSPEANYPGRARGRLVPRSAADVGREVLAGESGARGDEAGGCALEDDPAAVVAGAGAEVDDPVVRHDRLVVLDDDDGLAGVHEPVEQAEQLL